VRTLSGTPVPRSGLPLALSVFLFVLALTGCDSGAETGPAAARTPGSASTSSQFPSPGPTPTTTSSTGTSSTGVTGTGATSAPTWLGTRALPIGADGYGRRGRTPTELVNRRILTVDRLPPPTDLRFHSRIQAVPVQVARRSSWSTACPVSLTELRYLTVSFAGFDGRAHTGELLVNRAVAADVVTVFRRLHEARWPIEEMRITSPADLAAKPTGDGNNTSAFVCRPVRGRTSVWSQHAYGLAIDVNPFHNPYVDGRTVLPELATAYENRGRRLAGMNTPGSAPVRAFRAVGWGWGGTFTSKRDWMHFSSTGR
jgi:D-alanyl-D-alanine carboxypeptidase-like protein